MKSVLNFHMARLCFEVFSFWWSEICGVVNFMNYLPFEFIGVIQVKNMLETGSSTDHTQNQQ